ncbi:MAG: nicotinamide mononucleotide transporter family protein [Firmicutes bacterium]|nr:nicotinamide mononucleotide transporter family protein [Bacillota bacterium]
MLNIIIAVKILVKFHTSNIYPSTLSITTSFIAVYLTFRRNPYFSIAYAANDVVLIILWTLASTENIKYISVVICFTAFLFNDIYGFISWIRLEKMQKIDIGANQYGKRKKP